MNPKETKQIFSRAKKFRKKGLSPTDWENEPTSLAFTDFTKSIVTYSPNDLYQAFLTGYKMGLLEIDEVQLEAEFNLFKRNLEREEEE